jgi:hypothetical protein
MIFYDCKIGVFRNHNSNKMSETTKSSTTEFVKMENTDTKPIKVKSNSKLFVLGAALLFSLAANAFLIYSPEIDCPKNQTEELDNCLVSLEGSDDRIMNCLLQRAQEMTVREEAIGDCIAELKVTQSELNLYKKDQEDGVDNMSLEELENDINN